MEFKIKIFEKLDKDLEKIWSELENNSDLYVFQSYKWFENWHHTYLEKNKNYSLRVVVVEHNTKVISILPLQIQNKVKLNILKWAGDEELDYCCPILDKNFEFNKENFKIILNETLSKLEKVDVLKLVKQPKIINNRSNPFVLYLKNYFDSKSYSISLPNRWKTYEENVLKKEFKSQNKRKKNSLRKIGKLKYKIFKNKNEINKVINDLFEQKNKRLSIKKAETLFEKKDFDFYNRITRNEEKIFKIHLSSLELDKKILAMHLGAIHNKRFYYLILSMGSDLEKYSPGRLLISLLIKWSISKKLKFFDFTLGDELYKKSWSNSSSEYYNCIESKTFYGLIFIYFFKLKYLLKHYDRNRKFINILKKIKI